MRRWILLAAATLLAGPVLAKEQVLTIGTIAPQHAAWSQGLLDAAQEVRRRTDGRVAFKFRFAQENDAATLRNMRTQRFQGGLFTPSALQERYPDINLYGLPMVFNSAEEAAYVRSKLDDRLIDGLYDSGFVCFGFATTGFAVLMSNEPVRGLADVQGKEVWVPDNDPISYSAMRALGVNPQPDPLGNVLVGLQTNLYHMIAVSPIGALVMQWHTKVKYLTDVPLVYTFGYLAIDKRAFEKIEPADRKIVTEVMRRLFEKFNADGLADAANAKQALFDQGIERVVPSQQDFEQLRAVLAENNRKLAEEGRISEVLYDEMLGYIAEYREAHDHSADATTGE